MSEYARKAWQKFWQESSLVQGVDID